MIPMTSSRIGVFSVNRYAPMLSHLEQREWRDVFERQLQSKPRTHSRNVSNDSLRFRPAVGQSVSEKCASKKRLG